MGSSPRRVVVLFVALLAAVPSARADNTGPVQPPGYIENPLAPKLRLGPGEGVTVESADGRFGLNFSIFTLARYDFRTQHNDVINSTFQIRTLRPRIRGHMLVPWLGYFVQADLSGRVPQLLDFELNITPHPAVGVRFGQFRLPFSRLFWIPLPFHQFPDFPVTSDFFRPGRDTGIMVHGSPFNGYLDYFLMVSNGNGIDRGGNNTPFMLYTARLQVNPLGPVPLDCVPTLTTEDMPWKLSIGGGVFVNTATRAKLVADRIGFLGPIDSADLPSNERSIVANLDLAVYRGPWSFLAEGYYRRLMIKGQSRRPESWGAFAQTGVFVWRRYLEVAARFSWLDPNTLIARDSAFVYEALITGYVLSHHLKVNLRYALSNSQATYSRFGVPNDLRKGIEHLLTVNVSVWF